MGTSRSAGPVTLAAGILTLLLVTAARADDKCTAGCHGSSAPSPGFIDGTVYTYNVESVVSVFLTSADKQETNLKITGTATVTALGNCAHILRVQNLAISGPDGKKYGKPVGIEKSVRFTLQDGQLGSNICTEEEDNQRSINIKRAIISLLQNAHKQNTEVDVFGVCPTDITITRENGGAIIHKSRDLNSCAHREQGKHDLLTAIYNPHAQIKSTHLLQSTLNVESRLKGGVLERTIATEEYLFRPFSVGQNGARAKVVTKMTLANQAKGNEAAKPNVAKSIIFENPHPVTTEHSNVANVLLSLKSAAQSLDSNAGEKSASIFAGLVKVLRVTNKADILNIYSQIKSGAAVKDNNLARKVFLDALLRAGTGDSIEASIKLLKDNELSHIEQRIVFLSLTNARHVSSEALKSAAALLDMPNLPREVYLGVGALAGAYCREHECHGSHSQSEGVAVLSQKLASRLHGCKPTTKKDEDVVVAVLKGIRNIRHIEDSLIDKLAHCVTDKTVDARVKVAALEAFHADPCTPKLAKVALDTMKNRQLDSEVRIKAYLAAIECPSAKVANELKTLLDTEPVMQVGRFIVSSLRAIKASANPDRQSAKNHFGQIHTPNRFGVDNRRYSHFHELSYNVETLGTGATLEQTVIFSQDSFIPRSADLNLTAEIFGHSVNFMELGVRQGNLDRYAEHYLGPKGYLRNTPPQKIYDETLEKVLAVVDRFKERLSSAQRSRRNVKQEIAAFTKQIKNEMEPFSGHLELDVFVKLFGTDAIFLSLGDEHLSLTGLVDKIFDQLDSGIDKAKQFTHEFRNHLLFLDAELAYSTAIGIPLKLSVQGASTVKLGFGANIDLRRIIQDPKNAKIDIQAIPSANIEISSYLYADANLVTTGLKVFSTLHTSTGSHLVAKILENGKGIDIQLGLPVEKQELITVSHELVFTTAEKGQQETDKPLKFEVDRKDYRGCFDQLSAALGLTFCGELSVPWVTQGPNAGQSLQKLATRFPYSGPVRISVHLEKNDLKGFHMKGLLNDKDHGKSTLELVFEAEGTKNNNRRTSLLVDITNREVERGLKVEIKSPYKNVDAHALLLNNEKEKSVSLKLHNDNDEYFGKIGVAISGNGDRSVLTPLVEYRNPKHQNKAFNVEGNVVVEKQNGGRKFNFNGVSFLSANEKVQVDGYISQENQGFSTDLKVVQGKQHGSLSGKLHLIENGIKVDMEFHNTLNPNIDFLVNYQGIKAEGHVQNDLVLVHGPDSKSSSKKFSLNQNLKYHKKDSTEFDVITKNKVSYPVLEMELKADGEVSPKKVDIDFEGKYGKNKAEFEIEARGDSKKKGDYSVKFEGKVNENGVEFLSKRDIIDEDKSNWQNSLEVKPGGRYELNGVVTHRVKTNDVNVGVVGHLKVAGRDDDYKVDVGYISNLNTYSSHAKFTVGTADYVDYIFKLNKGETPNGSLKLLVKNIVNAQGQFKGNKADGKSNAVIIIDLLRAQRKLKVEGNFLCHETHHNANLDIFLDFERDQNNKIQLKTVTDAKDAKNFDSKNTIIVGDKKTDVHLKSAISGYWLTDSSIAQLAEVVLPSGRVLTFKLDRQWDAKDKEHQNGNVLVLASDAKEKGGATSKFQFTGKVTDYNSKERTFTRDAHIILSLVNGKNMDVSCHMQHVPKGEWKTFEQKTDITGNIIPKPVSFIYSVDYKNDEEAGADGKYRLKATYGSDIGIDGNGKLIAKKLEDGGRRYDSDVHVNVILPFEKAHDIKLTLTEGLTVPKEMSGTWEGSSSLGLQVNADTYKWDGSAKIDKSNSLIRVKVLVPKHEPITIEASHNDKIEGEVSSGNCEVKITYSNNKHLGVTVSGENKGHVEYKGKVHVKLPENDKVNDILIDASHNHHVPDLHKSLVKTTVDGKLYIVENSVGLTKKNPLFDLKITRPDNTVTSVYSSANIVSDKHFTVESNLVNFYGVTSESKYEVNVISPEEFLVKADINANRPNWKQIHFEASTKPDAKGKAIEVSITAEGKSLLSGSTSYLKKQEGGKTIIEGSGTVTYKDEQKAASFKYMKELVNEATEQGVEVFLKAEIGQKSFLIENKITNVEYKFNNVYCEEKKQCAHAEFSSKLNNQNPDQLQHSVQALVDLRKMGLSPEFGLQSNLDLHKNKLPVMTFDVYLNQDKSKYHLHAYSQPTKGAYPAGITLTLPQRVISLEQSVTYPEGKAVPLPIKGELVLYLNKKSEPNQKAALKMNADFQRVEHKTSSAIGDITFSHPALGKDLQVTAKSVYDHATHSLNSNLILDIFKKKNQRVVVTGKWNYHNVAQESLNVTSEFDISGKGLGIELAVFQHLAINHEEIGAGVNIAVTQDKHKKEAGVLLHASKQDLRLTLRAPSMVLLNVDGKFQLAKEAQVADLTVTLLQDKPVFVHGEVKTFQSFELSTGYKNVPENKLSISGRIVPEEKAEIKAEIIQGQETKDLGHAAIFLQDHVLKTDLGGSTENVKSYIKHLNTDVKAFLEHAKQTSTQMASQAQKDVQRTGQILKSAAPDFAHLGQFYKAEIDKIRDELVNDKTLQEINQFVKNTVQTLAKLFNDFVNNVTAIIDQSVKFVTEFYDKLSNVLHEKVVPQLKSLLDSVVTIATDTGKVIADFISYYVVLVTDFIEKHKDEFKELITAVNDLTRDVSKLVGKRLAEIRKDLSALKDRLIEQIKTLPIIQMIKEKWEEFTLPEQLEAVLTEAANALKAVLPTQELKDLVDVIYNYLTKKIKREKVNDAEELSGIYQRIVAAVKSLSEQLKGHIGEYNLGSFYGWNIIPISWVPGFRVPTTGSSSFSVWNYIRGEHNSWKDYVKSYKALGSGTNWVPPYRGRALIVDGGHIFTFDGRHLTFPGTCKYVLVHDSVDGNFTVSAVLDNGVIKSIILLDKSGIVVEAKDNEQVWLNEANHGYPVDVKGVAAWREYGSINLLSSSGVVVKCQSTLKLCEVTVSGFYFGKTRGLLGDLNNEPFDDFKIPNGKVVTSESDFGNAYRVTPSCPAIKTVPHNDHHVHSPSPVCDKLFTGQLSFKICEAVVDVNNYRQACQHAVSSNPGQAQEEACKIATAYTVACKESGLDFVHIPKECVHCQNGDQKHNIGEEYTITLPQKQADIVIGVETTKENEPLYKELVQPMISQIVDQLKAKKIDDVKVHLIGITSKMPYPVYFDTENNKLKGAKIKFTDPKRSDPWEVPIVTKHESLDKYIRILTDSVKTTQRLTATTNNARAIASLIDIPLRPAAVKSFILMIGDECPPITPSPARIAFDLLVSSKLAIHGVKPFFIAPTPQLEYTAGDAKQVVGFDEDNVFLLGGKKGGAELRKNLHNPTDLCSVVTTLADGIVYSSSNFVTLGAPQKKQFVQQTSHSIVDTLLKEEQHVECTCELTRGVIPTSDCHIMHPALTQRN